MRWRRGQTVILTQSSSRNHSSTSSSSWLGLLNHGSLRAQALCLELVLTPLASCLELTQAICALVILLSHAHLLPLFFRLFTQVHLLIDGSVEGQSITDRHAEYLFIAITPRSTLTWSVSPWYGPIDGSSKSKVDFCLTELLEIGLFWQLNCIFTLNWTVWNNLALNDPKRVDML